MKKALLILVAMMGALTTAQAYDYPYLIFETTGGTTTAVEVSSMTLTVSDGKLTVGSNTFTLTELSKMYFAESSTGIEAIRAAINEEVEVFTLTGVKKGTYSSMNAAAKQLQSGTYVIKTKSGNVKLNVK